MKHRDVSQEPLPANAEVRIFHAQVSSQLPTSMYVYQVFEVRPKKYRFLMFRMMNHTS
jgi:hypothetical protein